jgi:hypothetical protein
MYIMKREIYSQQREIADNCMLLKEYHYVGDIVLIQYCTRAWYSISNYFASELPKRARWFGSNLVIVCN